MEKEAITGTHWHALSANESLQKLDTSDQGLDESRVSERLKEFGPNKLPEVAGRSPLLRFLEQFHNVLIYILLAAAIVTAWLGDWVDSSVIFGVIIINAVIGFVQEGRAEKAIDGIRKMLSVRARVMRSGKVAFIPAEDLVPGDMVLLQSGDKVPADLRLTRIKNIKIDEAILTGESLPVEKNNDRVPEDALPADRKCIAYSGTFVTYGTAQGVVVLTGALTEIGRISKMMEDVKKLTTPLLRKIEQFGKLLSVSIAILAVVFFGLGYLLHDYSFTELFMAVIGITVALIPEGLPVLMTVTLALGVQKMARQNAIIRKLPSVETLGAVTVICSDKTGTLTRNEMTVTNLITDQKAYTVEGTGYSPEGRVLDNNSKVAVGGDQSFDQLIHAIALCNNAEANHKDGEWMFTGEPTETALISVSLKAGFNDFKSPQRLDTIPFESSHKFMAVLVKGEDNNVIYVKGAPEKLLNLCNSQFNAAGKLSVEKWEEKITLMASEGKRLIAAASKSVSPDKEAIRFEDVEDLEFIGLAAMIDPPRPEAIEAVKICRQAGIAVKMITGDHVLTASAIGKKLNMSEDINTVNGAELEVADDEKLMEIAERHQVFARTTPEHKLRLVQALQQRGHIVAMTGDGVNDAPALKKADVGIAMGIKGTEVTKEAADMILADDNFATISKAVFEGRTIYDNLRKAILFILPTNGAEGFVMMVSVLIGGTLPITPAQILWVNMVTAVTLGIALAFESGEPKLKQRPPRKPDEPILNMFLLWRIGFVSVLLGVATLGAFNLLLRFGADLEHARTVAVNTLVAGEAFYLINCRYIRQPVLRKGFFSNPKIFYSIGTIVLLQLFFTYVHFMNGLFGTASLSGREILWVLASGLLIFILVEVEKLIIMRMTTGKAKR